MILSSSESYVPMQVGVDAFHEPFPVHVRAFLPRIR